MAKLFTKEKMARLTQDERRELMVLQMSSSGESYGGGGYLPEDCSGCGACGEPILGTGWCDRCFDRFDYLTEKASEESPVLDLPAIKKRCEVATDVLDDAAFDAHLDSCRRHGGSNQEFGSCEYDPCAQRRFALTVLNTNTPQLVEALEEAQARLEAVRRAIDAASDSGQYSLALVEIGALLDLDRILKET